MPARRTLLRLAAALPFTRWSRGAAKPACDVCPKDQDCAFHSIREAVAASSPGDTIRLCPGAYREPDDGSGAMLTLDGDQTLIGAGAEQTILDGEGAKDRSVLAIAPEAWITLKDLTVTGGDDSGITIDRGDLTLTRCLLTRNRGTNGGGVRCTGDAALTLNHSRVTRNVATERGGGIYVDYCPTALQRGSRVTHNRAGSAGGGIFKVRFGFVLEDGSRIAKNTPNNCAGEQPPVRSCQG